MSSDFLELRTRVAYVSSRALLVAADRLPSNLGRASLVHQLIKSFNLISLSPNDDAEENQANRSAHNNHLIHVRSIPATREELLEYHDEEFIGEKL
jgi:hypothetical protein